MASRDVEGIEQNPICCTQCAHRSGPGRSLDAASGLAEAKNTIFPLPQRITIAASTSAAAATSAVPLCKCSSGTSEAIPLE